MDVLIEVWKPMLRERVDVGELGVVCSLEVPELVVAQNDVGNVLITLTWWTRLEVPSNNVLDVKVDVQDWVGRDVVDVLGVNRRWCEIGSVTLDAKL